MPIFYTENLKIPWDRSPGLQWKVSNSSGFYTSVFKQWWDHFQLKGKGLVIGEEGNFAKNVLAKLKSEYPKIEEVRSVSLEKSDVVWDICEFPPDQLVMNYDWIINQAVLEHARDPFAAMRNLSLCLKKNGMHFLHTVAPGFTFHEFPIDCCRFYRESLITFAMQSNLKVEDILWTPGDAIFAAYRKEKL